MSLAIWPTGVTPNPDERSKSRFRFRCGEPNCYMAIGCKTEEDAHTIAAEHGCPYQGGPTRFSWSATVSLVNQLWVELDRVVDHIMDYDESSGHTREYWQARASGLAFALSIFMVPHFRTEREISAEAKVRRDHRVAGTPWTTIGLESRRYEFAGDSKYKTLSETKKSARSAGVGGVGPQAGQLAIFNEQERAAIKQAIATKMFSREELAKVYKTTVEAIDEVANDPA
jgi:hypothetical protein